MDTLDCKADVADFEGIVAATSKRDVRRYRVSSIAGDQARNRLADVARFEFHPNGSKVCFGAVL